jgi:hypothetical protein
MGYHQTEVLTLRADNRFVYPAGQSFVFHKWSGGEIRVCVGPLESERVFTAEDGWKAVPICTSGWQAVDDKLVVINPTEDIVLTGEGKVCVTTYYDPADVPEET